MAVTRSSKNVGDKQAPKEQAGVKRQRDAKAEPKKKKSKQEDAESTPKHKADAKANQHTENKANQGQVLEYGRIYFFYKPKVNETDPKSIDDVAKLHLVLTPQGEKASSRLVIMGRKFLPEQHQQPLWGFVKTVSKDGASLRPHLEASQYETKTAGTRTVEEDRLFGEGPYAIVGNEKGQTSLVYVLAEPSRDEKVQRAFHLKPEGSFLMSVKNPNTGNPPGAGLSTGAKFSDKLLSLFNGKRWHGVNPVQFLDYENAEILLIGQHDPAEKPGIHQLEAMAKEEQEEIESMRQGHDPIAEHLYEDLRLKKDDIDTAPLEKGQWD